ncbi:ribosomal large subunit pseudouridine synthase B [Geomicrobium sp. JCM 19037]|uniref:pseudouridine synthase n=1 Tax=unclassified Geomicrobium TaxID=2628951 RepID=UPI00045F27AD|nr:pseudouridine synthase [Geomicrobium sp. JCM 19037]GAK02365.1 ribosomal large subunit pseudouridine synthase B [Geomicrobium sp. JCM 19037]
MERLQKVIAQAGITSRRKAETLITEGRVKVNGDVVKELGTKVSAKAEIEVDGVLITKEAPVYYLLYKPRKVISAVSDDKDRQVVTDLINDVEQRIFPVGRLDYDTSGILLLTNDGEFSNLMMHPKSKIKKTYIAKVQGKPSKDTLKKLASGVTLEDGKTLPAKASFKSGNKQNDTSIIELVITEGRNHQVRRMLEAVGHPVLKLKREHYSFLTLDKLNPGDYRPLKPYEVARLREMAVT